MAMEATSRDPGTGGENGTFRVLVVAAEEHITEPVQRELQERAHGREAEVRVVVPALADTAFEHAAGAVDEGLERAQHMLEESLSAARKAGVEGDGQVGDADPILAIDDALATFPADEIVVVTHPEQQARWMEDDLFGEASRKFVQPVTHFVVENGSVRAEEHAGPGRDEVAQAEVEPPSENLPRFSTRDITGILFAIVGTGILVVIAAANPDETASGFDFDAIHTLIAGAFALINIAHVVGLVLFESVGYRGIAQRFFADLSLYGTAVAIVVSLALTAV
jgi:lysozyme family protein